MDWDREGEGFLTNLVDGVLTIAFNRPEARNPISRGTSDGLGRVLEDARADARVRCLLVRGDGDHFSAGGDVAGFAKSIKLPREIIQAEYRGRLTRAANTVRALIAFDRPLVVRLRGAVAGAGLMFPLAADHVIADGSAQLVFAHQRLALTPDAGVSWLLPRVVGERKARHLLLGAAVVGARDALALGLIDTLVSGDELDRETAATAARLARAPQRASRLCKTILGASLDASLDVQLAAETEGIVACVGDDDFAEGVTAFLEKRPARFPSAT